MEISSKSVFFTISNIIKLTLAVAIISIMMLSHSQAKLLKVTATGTINIIFGFTDTSVVPFATGDPFSYELIVDDNPNLDTHPSPYYTHHSYMPNFIEGVAGAASVKFGAYTIQATNVKTTSLSVVNSSYDKIEIISKTEGITARFSLHQNDPSGQALSNAIVTPELFLNNGFMDLEYNAVFLFMDDVAGPCVGRRCAIGYIENINVTPVDICGDGNLSQAKKYKIPIPSTTNLDCGRVIWAQDADSGERLEIIWQCSPSGDYYDFVYKGPGGNPQGQVGLCHFNQGANHAYYIAPETSPFDKPDYFIIAGWMSLDGYEDDNRNGYLDVYGHWYDACNAKYGRSYYFYKYAQGCDPISEEKTFTELKPGCENWSDWPQLPDSPFIIDPPLGPETEALFDELLAELEEFPHQGQSIMGNLSILLCDIDMDGDCDIEDRDAAKALVGACSGDDSFYPFADLDGDSCITDFDLKLLFLIGDFDGDCDVDGSDLAKYLSDSDGLGLEVFAATFGKNNCPY